MPQQYIRASSTDYPKPEVTTTGSAAVEPFTAPSKSVTFNRNASTDNNVLLTTASKQWFGLTTSKSIGVNNMGTGNNKNNSKAALKKKVRRILSRQYMLYEYLDYSGV